MVNQICIAGLVQGLAEGLHFAGRAGLDRQLVVDVISKGAAQSWQMDNRHKTMIAGKFDFGFAVDWMRKDLGICLDEARRNGARCRSPRSSTSSMPKSRRSAGALGHVEPDRAAGRSKSGRRLHPGGGLGYGARRERRAPSAFFQVRERLGDRDRAPAV